MLTASSRAHSSHMLDLSEESKEENIADCVKYFKRMAPLDSEPGWELMIAAMMADTFRPAVFMEMEIGITGGEEDGVDNSNADNASLYTQPEDIYEVFSALVAVSPNFSIAAA